MKPIISRLVAAPSAAVKPLAKKALLVGTFVVAISFFAAPALIRSAGNAADPTITVLGMGVYCSKTFASGESGVKLSETGDACQLLTPMPPLGTIQRKGLYSIKGKN